MREETLLPNPYPISSENWRRFSDGCFFSNINSIKVLMMKNFLKNLAAIFVLAATLSSCENFDLFNQDNAEALIEEIAQADNKTVVELTSLPASLTRYVANNYFETYIESAEKAPKAGYEVTLGSADVLYFDLEGTSLDSLATCSSDSTGHRHHGRPRGGHGGPRPGSCGGVDSLVDVAALPAGILAYVTANYGDSAAIVHAKLNANGEYVVAVTGHVILVFDANGNFLQVAPLMHHCGGHHGTPIAIADLLPAITDYIQANYAGAEIKVAFQKGTDRIVVGLLYNGQRTILIFDGAGNFIEVRN